MPILSKYSDQQVENLVDDLLKTLVAHKAPLDLSLMSLGNTLSHIINEKVPAAQRQALIDNFTQALKDSVK
ncbi:MAG: DUF1414 domain-containing protein [Pseudomonadota bacterium]|uniref:UPF0352 protein WAE96_07910 n=1 Tax=Pseudoalteromonas spongiae TaxID=298657 RepID=A0ABU8EUA1_9GAMM|nr:MULTISPECIES: DUF1414 domain-containing protein [Pseudoalteromonas]MEC8328692.1 DUF1414 domain-containing protein [Pseudomonadota bacterium]ATC98853.1 hypothetical protein PSPO_a1814 [Pseudoalteromonas spongiae UST010723-006]KPV94235.1 hypothetical protein AN214_03729 [Pseudoalteromonas sp. P1-9]MCF6456138.1 DUF1414 domain-containing protein [Pseudoalteromonas sp. MMG024]TMO81565.1 hypothetical protein CWC15_21115 [Pseudoalteromonas spongiae]